MNKYQSLAYEFQNLPGSLYLPLPSSPTPLPEWAVDLWRRLITEEKDELIEALESGDIAQIVHEQCDLLYVLYGCACWMGMDVQVEYQYGPLEVEQLRDFTLLTILSDKSGYNIAMSRALTQSLGVFILDGDPLSTIDLWPSYQAIHAANMAKRVSGQWKDGKAVKPEGWQPTDIASVLRAQGVLLDN